MTLCDRTQQQLAELFPTLAQLEPELREHLQTCAGCKRFHADLARLESSLQQLPAYDIADPKLIQLLESQAMDRSQPQTLRRKKRWPLALAAAFLLALGVVALAPLFTADVYRGEIERRLSREDKATYRSAEPQPKALAEAEEEPGLSAQNELAKNKKEFLRESSTLGDDRVTLSDNVAPAPLSAPEPVVAGQIAQRSPARQQAPRDNRLPQSPLPQSSLRADNSKDQVAGGKVGFAFETQAESKPPNRDAELARQAYNTATGARAAGDLNQPAERAATAALPVSPQQALASTPHDQALTAARRFLANRETLSGIRFQAASGYWANTYVPGDPEFRVLAARLNNWPQTGFAGLRLEHAAGLNRQPFDAPRDAAMALYLQADKTALDGPRRLRVQVGLKATARRQSLRPPMSIGVVLDMRAAPDAAAVYALIDALQRSRQAGDRFWLMAAGAPGGMLVPPEQFRYGPLRLALDQLFGSAPAASSLDIQQAVALAANSISAEDQAGAPLSSRLVLLLTAAPLTDDLPALEPLAHRNAVAGVRLSVVGIGDRISAHAIQRLVLAGQGNRRVLNTPTAAAKLIENELYAASRTVAQALRLRIRLAPGVKLIAVLDSEKLAEPQAQRVREAEQSIDRRLARQLGIRADRGDDEEGIQIVIPSFYADDAHVVLLDVVAERAGKIAEVGLRYKDLIYGRNGVAQAQLTLPRGEQALGPLEYNVLKNQLALQLAQTARRAAGDLSAGQSAAAAAALADMRDLYAGLRDEITALANDVELLEDERLLTTYLQVLHTAPADLQPRLAELLRYSAYRKLVPEGENTL